MAERRRPSGKALLLSSGGIVALLCLGSLVGDPVGGLILSSVLISLWAFMVRTALFASDGGKRVTYEQYCTELQARGGAPPRADVPESSRILSRGLESDSGAAAPGSSGKNPDWYASDPPETLLRVRTGGRERESEDRDFADFLRSNPF